MIRVETQTTQSTPQKAAEPLVREPQRDSAPVVAKVPAAQERGTEGSATHLDIALRNVKGRESMLQGWNKNYRATAPLLSALVPPGEQAP